MVSFARTLQGCVILLLLASCGGGDASSDGGGDPPLGGGPSGAALYGTVTASFENTPVGTTSAVKTMVIRSVGTAAAVFGTQSITGPFAIVGTTCKGSVPSGSECTVDLVFKPTAIGSANGIATIRNNGDADYLLFPVGVGFEPSGFVRNVFQPSAGFAAMCETPRSGIDPYTGRAFPDRLGKGVDERNWMRSWSNELYLWYNQIFDRDPGLEPSTAQYFTYLKAPAPQDKFHFTYETSEWQALSQTGTSADYGAAIVLLSATPPRSAVIAYTQPSSPAAIAGLTRGTFILTVDNADLVGANDQASVNTLNAGLYPDTVGETHTFAVRDPGSTVARSVTLTSANVVSAPVQFTRAINTPTGKVGCLLFNDHIATAEGALVTAITTLRNEAVTDLVLDLRYNGGGYLAIASELAYMIAGSTRTAGMTFEKLQFNDKHPVTDPVTGQPLTPIPFLSVTQGFSLPPGQALPSLGLGRVYVLTGASTCSASESIINSLQGVNVQVIQFGAATCGKPYGFYPTDNCGTTYFSIQFRGVNAKGFGDYLNGFSPANSAAGGVSLPGCTVGDDFAHELGDTAEGRLALALNYRATGSCALPPASVRPQSAAPEGTWVPPVGEGPVLKTRWLQNRILER